jgi:hypothetical protein
MKQAHADALPLSVFAIADEANIVADRITAIAVAVPP